MAIAKKPERFWDERVDALTRVGVILSHAEFSERYVQEAKSYIASFPEDVDTFWFKEETLLKDCMFVSGLMKPIAVFIGRRASWRMGPSI